MLCANFRTMELGLWKGSYVLGDWEGKEKGLGGEALVLSATFYFFKMRGISVASMT